MISCRSTVRFLGQWRRAQPVVAPGVLPDDLAIAPDHDAIGVNPQLRGAPRRLDRDAVAVVVEARQATLRHRDLDLAEAVERAAIIDQAGLLRLENLPYGLVG